MKLYWMVQVKEKLAVHFSSYVDCVLTSVLFFYFGVWLIYFGYALVDRQFCYHAE